MTTNGKVQFERPADPSQLGYFLRVPTSGGKGAPVLVAVHGISRNAAEHALRFAATPDWDDHVIVAPLFERKVFGRYQQLEASRTGQRSDLAFLGLLDQLTDAGFSAGRVDLFGFSGGAQFAHRFGLHHPKRLASLSLAAAGWYTAPDEATPFPLGVGRGPDDLPAARLDALLGLPIQVMVGEMDTRRDATLRSSTWLDQTQGRNRLERAGAWVGALRAAARDRGIEPRLLLDVLSGCGHDFGQCVVDADMLGRAARNLVRLGPNPRNPGREPWPLADRPRPMAVHRQALVAG